VLGWRRSDDRTCLPAFSLQTGNFQGIPQIWPLGDTRGRLNQLHRSGFRANSLLHRTGNYLGPTGKSLRHNRQTRCFSSTAKIGLGTSNPLAPACASSSRLHLVCLPGAPVPYERLLRVSERERMGGLPTALALLFVWRTIPMLVLPRLRGPARPPIPGLRFLNRQGPVYTPKRTSQPREFMSGCRLWRG
jgi:hypothetical protein